MFKASGISIPCLECKILGCSTLFPRRLFTELWRSNKYREAERASVIDEGGRAQKYSETCCRHSGHGRIAGRVSSISTNLSTLSTLAAVVWRKDHSAEPHTLLFSSDMATFFLAQIEDAPALNEDFPHG